MQKSHSWAHLRCLLLFAIFSSSSLLAENELETAKSNYVIEHSLNYAGVPDFQYTFHKRSNLKVTKTNYGLIGSGLLPGVFVDPFSGQEGWVGSEFPTGSQISHFQNYLMIGAVVR